MKVIAVNGSPRKKWNTSELLNKVLEGAAAQGAETEIIHLYDLNYKGCTSCFLCRLKGSKYYGKCGMQDDLTPILKKLMSADAIVLGSPIYLWNVTGQMRAFMERFIYPYIEYSNTPTISPRKIPTGLIYTMNTSEELMKKNLDKILESNERFLKIVFGEVETLYSTETYQFDDYSKVVSDRFDAEVRLKRRQEVFPVDCNKAYDMGVVFVRKIRESAKANKHCHS